MAERYEPRIPGDGSSSKKYGLPTPTTISVERFETQYRRAPLPGEHDFRLLELKETIRTLREHPGTMQAIDAVTTYLNKLPSNLKGAIPNRVLATIMVYTDAAKVRGRADYLDKLYGKETNEPKTIGDQTSIDEPSKVRERLHPETREMYDRACIALVRKFGLVPNEDKPKIRGLLAEMYGQVREAYLGWSSALHLADLQEGQIDETKGEIRGLKAELAEMNQEMDIALCSTREDTRTEEQIGTLHDLLSEGKAGLELLVEHLEKGSKTKEDHKEYGPFANGHDLE